MDVLDTARGCQMRMVACFVGAASCVRRLPVGATVSLSLHEWLVQFWLCRHWQLCWCFDVAAATNKCADSIAAAIVSAHFVHMHNGWWCISGIPKTSVCRQAACAGVAAGARAGVSMGAQVVAGRAQSSR
jgi:hypothetical protein